jgi:hypothetical protein
MSDDADSSRAHGIELGSLAEELAAETYPLTQAEIVERYGDHELDLASETTRVDEVLGDDMAREYEDVESVRQSIFNMVGGEAVGREEYSDRSGSVPNEDTADEESI